MLKLMDIIAADVLKDRHVERVLPEGFTGEDGRLPEFVYHASLHQFDQFKLTGSDMGLHFGNINQALSRIEQIIEKKNKPVSFYLYKVKLTVNSTLIVHDDIFHSAPFPLFRKLCSEEVAAEISTPIFTDSEEEYMWSKWDIDFCDGDNNHTSNDHECYRDLEKILANKGYDSICYPNFHEDKANLITHPYSWCVFDPVSVQIVSVEKQTI